MRGPLDALKGRRVIAAKRDFHGSDLVLQFSDGWTAYIDCPKDGQRHAEFSIPNESFVGQMITSISHVVDAVGWGRTDYGGCVSIKGVSASYSIHYLSPYPQKYAAKLELVAPGERRKAA